MEFNIADSGIGLGSLLLTVGLLTTLIERDLLAAEDARDIVDLALINLQMHEKLGQADSREIMLSARRALENIRAQF